MDQKSLEDLFADEQFIESHPHFRKIRRDRIGLIKYARYALTKSHQISNASVFYDSNPVDLPGDWIVSIAKDAIIITSQGFPFPHRIPIIVKSWKRKKDSSERKPFGTYVDQDNFEWYFEKGDPRFEFFGSRDRLTALNADGSDSMIFDLIL